MYVGGGEDPKYPVMSIHINLKGKDPVFIIT